MVSGEACPSTKLILMAHKSRFRALKGREFESAGVRNERKGTMLLVAKQDSRDNYLVAWRSYFLIG